MATLPQLLKLQRQIDADEEKLGQKRARRGKLIDELNLEKGDYFRSHRGENFVTVDGKPYRLWISANGRVELEELGF
jgi:hypothetical protein